MNGFRSNILNLRFDTPLKFRKTAAICIKNTYGLLVVAVHVCKSFSNHCVITNKFAKADGKLLLVKNMKSLRFPFFQISQGAS